MLCYKLRVVRLGIADRAPELEFQSLKRLPLRKLRQNVFYSGTVWRVERRCRWGNLVQGKCRFLFCKLCAVCLDQEYKLYEPELFISALIEYTV